MGDETLPIKSSGLTKDDIALMVRELVLVTLPHKDPGDIPEWVRRNGNITLAIQPGYKPTVCPSHDPSKILLDQ